MRANAHPTDLAERLGAVRAAFERERGALAAWRAAREATDRALLDALAADATYDALARARRSPGEPALSLGERTRFATALRQRVRQARRTERVTSAHGILRPIRGTPRRATAHSPASLTQEKNAMSDRIVRRTTETVVEEYEPDFDDGLADPTPTPRPADKPLADCGDGDLGDEPCGRPGE